MRISKILRLGSNPSGPAKITIMFKILRNLKNFVSGIFTELKNVSWIKPGLVIKYTLSVVLFLIIATLLIVLVDKGFLLIRNLIIPV